MMTLDYLRSTLVPENFYSTDHFTLVSRDQRIKIVLYPEGGFGSYYDGIWWEEAEFEGDFEVTELTCDIVEAFDHPLY